MFYDAKNSSVKIGNTDMDYISFGRGEKNLIMIPGIGDGFKTVKGLAVSFAMMFRKYAKDYKVYVFSRKNKLEECYSTRDMAKDQREVMEKLGISKAHIIGISQGGMIAQYIAIDYPELVEKLVLVVSISKQNETIQNIMRSWIEMAKSNDYRSLIIDSTEKSYTEEYIKRKKYRLFYPIIVRITKPKDLSRFIIQANSCINHNAYDELDKIKSPTLIIGGDSDKIVGKNSSEEMAQKIKDTKLIMYKGLGHSVYEEAKDFHHQVLEFLTKRT